jgi:hypothetical protein
MMSEKFIFNRKFQSTYDLYRVRFEQLGYLEKVKKTPYKIQPGAFKKIKDIPKDMTTTDTMILYKNKRFKLKNNGKITKSK